MCGGLGSGALGLEWLAPWEWCTHDHKGSVVGGGHKWGTCTEFCGGCVLGPWQSPSPQHCYHFAMATLVFLLLVMVAQHNVRLFGMQS